MSRALGWPERHAFGPANLRHLASVLERLDRDQPKIGMLWQVDIVAPTQVWEQYGPTEPGDGNEMYPAEQEQRVTDSYSVSDGPSEHNICPDGGACYHLCPSSAECWRVKNAGPLSGVYPDDRWPHDATKLVETEGEYEERQRTATKHVPDRAEKIVLKHLRRTGYKPETVAAEIVSSLRADGLMSPRQDWTIQHGEPDQAPFLLYQGVLVARVYGGAPYDMMLDKLNAEEEG